MYSLSFSQLSNVTSRCRFESIILSLVALLHHLLQPSKTNFHHFLLSSLVGISLPQSLSIWIINTSLSIYYSLYVSCIHISLAFSFSCTLHLILLLSLFPGSLLLQHTYMLIFHNQQSMSPSFQSIFLYVPSHSQCPDFITMQHCITHTSILALFSFLRERISLLQTELIAPLNLFTPFLLWLSCFQNSHLFVTFSWVTKAFNYFSGVF